MKGQATSPVLSTPGYSEWIEGIAAQLILRAARSAPGALSERLEEEWLAALSELRGQWRRVRFALGCRWAVIVRADRRAKYDIVAKVLASAQRNRIKKTGFADTAEFRD